MKRNEYHALFTLSIVGRGRPQLPLSFLAFLLFSITPTCCLTVTPCTCREERCNTAGTGSKATSITARGAALAKQHMSMCLSPSRPVRGEGRMCELVCIQRHKHTLSPSDTQKLVRQECQGCIASTTCAFVCTQVHTHTVAMRPESLQHRAWRLHIRRGEEMRIYCRKKVTIRPLHPLPK